MNTRPVPNQDALVAKAAEAALGGAQPAQPPAQPQQTPPNLDTSTPAPETTLGNAEAQGSPETEGDKMAMDAILYEIQREDGTTKKMTPQQISSMMDRYSSLNYQHAQMKPVFDVVSAYIKSNPNENPQTVAKKLLDIARGQQPQPQFGAAAEAAQDQKAANAPLDPQALKQWVEENAINGLPPGYEDMVTNMGQQQKQMQAMMAMMQRVLGSAQGMTQASAMATRGQQQNQQQLINQQIANNLDRVQAHLKLPDTAAQDFMMFAAERGYSEADFIDANLTFRVMQDFARAAQGPEMERIREIAGRRQAWTGAGMGATPTVGGPQAQPTAETPLDRMTQAALQKRSV